MWVTARLETGATGAVMGITVPDERRDGGRDLGLGSVGVSPAKLQPAADRAERAELPVGRHAHAVRGRLPGRRRRQDRALRAPLGRHDRRKGPWSETPSATIGAWGFTMTPE